MLNSFFLQNCKCFVCCAVCTNHCCTIWLAYWLCHFHFCSHCVVMWLLMFVWALLVSSSAKCGMNMTMYGMKRSRKKFGICGFMLVENKWLNCFNMQSSVLPKVHENIHKIYMKCWYILRALYISRLQRRKKCDWDSEMPNAKCFAWYLNATTIGNIFFAIMTKRKREKNREGTVKISRTMCWTTFIHESLEQ